MIAVDARDLTRYRPIGVTLVKPNYDETLRLVGAEPQRPACLGSPWSSSLAGRCSI